MRKFDRLGGLTFFNRVLRLERGRFQIWILPGIALRIGIFHVPGRSPGDPFTKIAGNDFERHIDRPPEMPAEVARGRPRRRACRTRR